jgi:anti-sigma factor RsiW
MDCRDVRLRLLDYQRGRLEPPVRDDVRGHLESCAACAGDDAVEWMLTELLEDRLPQHAAPLSLKRRLAAAWPVAAAPRRWWRSRWPRAVAPALAVAVVLLAVLPLILLYSPVATGNGQSMVAEAVNDHLRLLSSQHPLDIESGGMHQVKPWFEGRLDFAPVVPFLGDQEFPLRGGAVGYFVDRQAAVFVFHRRLHAISLLVFRAEGLPWPTRGLDRIGRVAARVTVARGFNAILWRNGELGYALISDVDRQDLLQLATRLVDAG